MKIYFAADNQAGPNLQQRYAEIITMLTKAGVLVMSNLINEQLSTFSQSDRRAIEHSGEIMLDRVDALIMEGTSQIPESGYMIALAMAHHKPVLYLWEEGKPINQSLRHLHSGKEAAKLLDLQNYEPKNISTIVFNFLKKVQKGEARQKPSIKFTLRITERIEKYLTWKTHNSKLSKADFLRELIEKIIDEDPEYQKFFGDK